MRRTLNKRLLREEGFTLTEMMVTIIIMIIVLLALYSIFDMSVKTQSFGNSKAEAMENARLGMEKMDREIRQAFPFDKANGNTQLFDAWDTSEISFTNDLDGDLKTLGECNADGDCEQISYSLDDGSLMRTSGGDPHPVVDHVTNVEFSYLQRDGTLAGDEEAIERVRIVMDVSVGSMAPKDGTQTLITDVALRNRGD